mgnify:CR=1 FL=1
MTVSFSHKFTFLAFVTAILIAGIGTHARAQDAAVSPGPGEVVADATSTIMAVVAEAPDYFDEDPQRYFDAIGAELDKVVDFRSFARGVMGKYASSDRVRSLNKEQTDQLRNQLEQFTDVLRASLISTYARGLLAFGGVKLDLGDVEMAPNSNRVASVSQFVKSEDGKVYTLKYQMGQYKDGRWRLRNMIIENINLGEIYRSQFEAAADEAGGDLDRVIAQWTDTDVETPTEEQ